MTIWIELTAYTNGGDIRLRVDHIIAISDLHGENRRVVFVSSGAEFEVQESMAQITKMMGQASTS